MPLLGDDFPELKVQTTQGPMNIPGDFKGKWLCYLVIPPDFTTGMHNRICSFSK